MAAFDTNEAVQKFLSATGGPLTQSTEGVQQLTSATNSPAIAPNLSLLTPQTNAVLQNLGTEAQKFLAATGGPLTQQNAPPAGVSASSSISKSEQEGRRDLQGEVVPLDFQSGLPLNEYLPVAFQRDSEAKAEVLKKMYPDRKVRVLDSGDVTIEVIDGKTGKLKDVILNPAGIDAHDAIDLATQVPEIAASTLVALATRGKGFLKTAGQILASSIAGAGTGAIKDVYARAGAGQSFSEEGVPIRLDEIKNARSQQAVLDTFLQGGIGIGSQALKILSPFARDIKPGTLEFDLQQGQRYFKDHFNLDLKLTPADKTGSPALGAIEQAEARQPGARNVFQSLKEHNKGEIQAAQRIALGGPLASEEDVGGKAIDLFKNNIVMPVEQALTDARNQAQAKGQKRIVDLIDNAIGATGPNRVTPTTAGTATLAEFDAKLAAADANVKTAYEAVRALPGGTGDVISGEAAARVASKIREELPAVLKTKQKETGLLDSAGNPITRAVQEREVKTSGVPDGLLKALSDLESLKGGKVSLQTLTSLKRAAYDEIAKTEAVPGVKDRWFNQIAKAYEQGIEAGVNETGDPALKAALTNAKETYKKELLPFDRPGIREMAKDEFDTARLSPEQVANRLFEGPKAIENYRLLKNTLGANSPSLKILKRAWADSQIASATDELTGAINPEKLGNLFRTMANDKPELAKEIFGSHYQEIASSLAVNKALGKITSLDESELRTILNLKDPTVADFHNVLQMAKNRDTAYVNGIVKDIADGLPIASKLKPTEFVRRLENAKTPSLEVSQILDTISKEDPALRRNIAQIQLYKLLDAGSVQEAATATKALQGQPVNLSANKIEAAVGSPNTDAGKRVRLLLGTDKITPSGTTPEAFIENLVKVLAPGEKRASDFSAAGGISGGAKVLQAAISPLKYASSFLQKYIMADIYLNSQKAIGNTVFNPANTAMIANALIASEPFVRRAVEILGPETAKQMLSEAKRSIDKSVLNYVDSPQGRKNFETQRFLQGQPAKMQMQPRP